MSEYEQRIMIHVWKTLSNKSYFLFSLNKGKIYTKMIDLSLRCFQMPISFSDAGLSLLVEYLFILISIFVVV